MQPTDSVKTYWLAVEARDWTRAWSFLHDEFEADWPVTGERWDRDSFMRLNQEYLGDWHVRIERIERLEEGVLSVVYITLGKQYFYAISFFEFRDEKFIRATEYWADGAEPPAWRKKKQASIPIRLEPAE